MSLRLALVVLAVTVVAGAVVAYVLSRPSDRERFVDDATAICDASKHDIDVAFGAQLSGGPDEQQIARFLSAVLVPELRERLDRLEGLELPADDRARLEDLFVEYRAEVDAIANDPAAAVSLTDPFAAVDERFDAYGLPACGSAPPRSSSSS
ncbi:MAG: hypothetical protein ACRD29_05250 [Acidimicrobiales bacterium]